jgi:hypothetical protein
MKTCTKCGKEKRLNHFAKSKSGRDGLRCDCKKCVAGGQAMTYRPRAPALESEGIALGDRVLLTHSRDRGHGEVVEVGGGGYLVRKLLNGEVEWVGRCQLQYEPDEATLAERVGLLRRQRLALMVGAE